MASIFDLLNGSVQKKLNSIASILKSPKIQGPVQQKPIQTTSTQRQLPSVPFVSKAAEEAYLKLNSPKAAKPVQAPIYKDTSLRSPTSSESDRILLNSFKANPTVAGGFNFVNQVTNKLGNAITARAGVKENPINDQEIKKNISLSTLPSRVFGSIFPASARVTEAVTRPFLSSAEKTLNYANKSDEYKTNNFTEGVAGLGNTAYEAYMLYGALGKKAPPFLRGLAGPRLFGAVSTAAPEDAQGYIRPALEAYSFIKSPSKLTGVLNVLAGRATDPISNALNQSNFSQPVKDLGNLGINLAENLAAVGGSKVLGKYISDVGKAGKAALPAIAEGRRVYNQTGSFDKALDAMTYNNLELEKGLKKAITGESEVKGFSNIPKNLEPLAQEALKYKNADEFVKSHGTPIYHGSDKKINTFSNKKGSQGVIWFTDNPKPITSGESGAQGTKYINERITTGKKFAGWDEYEKYGLGQIESMGFDGIKLPTSMQDGTKYNDYILFDSKTLKTKSELTDLWNQAHSQKQDGVSQVKGFSNIPKPIDASEVKIPPKVVEQKFRGDKLNLEPEQLKQIEDRLSGLGLTSRNVRSFDEMKALADELGTDPRALLSGNGKLTDAKVIALKNLINQNADFIAKNSGLKFKTEQENAIHQQKLRTADAQINEALAQLIGGGTELGRGIAAFRVLANKSMEPSFWYKKGQQTRGNALTPEQKANIDGLIKDNDRIGLSMYVASLRDPSLSEKFTTLWKAGLLTNVTTHVANVAGNASMAALRGLSNIVGTGIDKLVSPLFGGRRTMTVSPGAAIGGLGKGAKKGLNILRTGVNPDDFEGKLDIRGNINFGDSILGKVANGYTRAVFGSLQAEDALFRGMHQSASLANQAKLIAINEGLKGQARQTRIAELLENPTDVMKQTAIEEARIATFNNDNIVASKVGQLKAGRNKDDSFGSKVLSTVVDVTMPFVKTPTNVVARIAEYTPLGLLKLAAGQLNKNTRGQKRLVEDLSKVVTGGAVLALGSALANQGMLTGSLPASPSERAQWEAEGKMPNSIKINGRWYQVNKLAPIGFLFALAADNATSGSVAETGLKGLKNLTDQTFLTGLSGGIKAVTDPEQNAASYAKQTVSSLIPSGLGAIARVVDPTARTTGGVVEAIQAKIPGLSSSLAPRLDVFGQEVKNEGGVLGLLDPTRSKADKSNDPVLREFAKLGVNVGLPSNRMFNTELDTYEYAEFQKVNGRVLKDVLDTLVVSPLFQNASTAKKQELLEKTVSKVRTKTKEAVFPKILQKRFNLPTVQNPQLLNELANKLYKNEAFNNLSKEEQQKVLLGIVQQL